MEFSTNEGTNVNKPLIIAKISSCLEHAILLKKKIVRIHVHTHRRGFEKRGRAAVLTCKFQGHGNEPAAHEDISRVVIFIEIWVKGRKVFRVWIVTVSSVPRILIGLRAMRIIRWGEKKS